MQSEPLIFGKFINLLLKLSMKLVLLLIGKTGEKYLQEGIDDYTKRLRRYIDFKIEVVSLPGKLKNSDIQQQKINEGSLIVSKMKASQHLCLFDENGEQFSSRQLALFLQKKMASGVKELVFVVGGPYGFSDEIYNLADSKISLSKMTFSHQLARLLCLEQLYRAFTILKGEPYHHD